jgi:hypothetical protein
MADDDNVYSTHLVVGSTSTATWHFGQAMVVVGRPPPEHQIHSLIGQVTAEWSHMEHVLDTTIWYMANIDGPIGACVTGQMTGHYPRFLTIKALAAYSGMSKDILAEIERLRNKTSELAEDRNRIVHDAWYVYGDQTVQFRSMDKRNMNFGIVPYDITKLEGVLVKIAERAKECEELQNKIKAELGSSQGTPG